MVDLLLAAPPAPLAWDRLVAGRLECQFRADVGGALTDLYRRNEWVYDALAAQPDARLFRGRRPVVSGRLGDLPVVVKRMFHGGLLAKLSGDAFLTSGRVRAHAAMSDHLTAHGIPTPPVVFASWRRVRGLVRCEVGFELVEGIDADRYFFGDARPPAEWQKRAADLGSLVARLHEIGFRHADMNLMNFLFGSDGETYVLDLDKSACEGAPLSKKRCRRNLDRLERSIRKQGRGHLRALAERIVRKVRTSYGLALAQAQFVILPELLSWDVIALPVA